MLVGQPPRLADRRRLVVLLEGRRATCQFCDSAGLLTEDREAKPAWYRSTPGPGVTRTRSRAPTSGIDATGARVVSADRSNRRRKQTWLAPRPARASSTAPTPRRGSRSSSCSTKAYWMEIETVMSYIAASVNLDGVRAQEIKQSLAERRPGGARPRAALRRPDQGALRRRSRLGGVRGRTVLPAAARGADRRRFTSIKGVIEAETGAIEHYTQDRRGDRRRRPGHPGHGDRDPPRRAGPSAPLRGLPARV